MSIFEQKFHLIEFVQEHKMQKFMANEGIIQCEVHSLVTKKNQKNKIIYILQYFLQSH